MHNRYHFHYSMFLRPHPPFLCLQYVYVVSDGKIGEREGEGEGELETGLVLPMC